MLTKSSSILYLFNFDGTVLGLNRWHGSWTNSKEALLSGPIINPGDKVIRWHILCNRPVTHKPFVRSCCWLWGLYPKSIHTIPKKILKTKSRKDVLNFKLAFFRRILIGNHEEFANIKKIFYVDSNLDDITYLNANRQPFRFVCVHIKDFIEEKFNILL